MKKHFLNGTYYLNNNGSRWVVYVDGEKPKHQFQTTDGDTVTRMAIEYRSFGNFGCVLISWMGKKMTVLADSVLDRKTKSVKI